MNHTKDINPKSYYGLALGQDLIDDKRQEEWQGQRLERGFDETEIWSLDMTIIKFILPRLKAYLEVDKRLRSANASCWSAKEKEEILKYHQDLKNIIETFEQYNVLLNKEQSDKFNEAMKTFVEIFSTFWI